MKIKSIQIVLVGFLVTTWGCSAIDSHYLDKAREVEKWLSEQKNGDGDEEIWVDEIGSERVSLSLSSGVSGKVLFYLELFLATKDDKYLEEAIRGCNYITANLPKTTKQATSIRNAASLYGDIMALNENATKQDTLKRFWQMERYGFMGGTKGEPATFTGYFYGSAGLGRLYIKLHNLTNHKNAGIRLPDSPF